MTSKKFFYEEQKFQHWWVWLIMFPILIALIVYFNQEFDRNDPMTSTELMIVIGVNAIVMIGLVILFLTMKMETEVRSDGIKYRFLPFQNKYKVIAAQDIEKFEIRKYKSIKEYGGKGYKKKTIRYGESYTVKGEIGLQLYLKNGKKLLLGTQRAEALRSSVNKLMRKDNV